MKVAIDQLRVNRAPLTRQFHIAGLPVTQMYTHIPALKDAMFDPALFKKRWGMYEYNRVIEASTQGGGYKKPEPLIALAKDIRANGIKDPVELYNITEDIKEVFAGHHRIVLAHLRGDQIVPFTYVPFTRISQGDLTQSRAAYRSVPQTENLKTGYSYNPFPGFVSLRYGWDRLFKIYKEIMKAQGCRLADFGCNDGFFGASFAEHDFEVTFVDKSPAYMSVVEAKMETVSKVRRKLYNHYFHIGDITEYLEKYKPQPFDVSLYMDVFYHVVLERGLPSALKQFDLIYKYTKEYLIFSPGRWDKLAANNFTPYNLFTYISKKPDLRSIKYLGTDNDKNYHREIYCIAK